MLWFQHSQKFAQMEDFLKSFAEVVRDLGSLCIVLFVFVGCSCGAHVDLWYRVSDGLLSAAQLVLLL